MQAKLDNRYLSKFVCGRENPCEHKAAGLRISVVEFIVIPHHLDILFLIKCTVYNN